MGKKNGAPEQMLFHHFDGKGVCIYCSLKDINEHKKPYCKGKRRKGQHKQDVPFDATVGTKTKKSYVACHEGHPVLKFGELGIHGGSCNYPKVKGCDVYIGFDQGMRMTPASMPWKRGTKEHVEEVFYHVSDMTAPKHPKEFKALVEWTLKQMKEGKKVHAGCIGGHGRTGTFFAALAAMQTEVVIEDCVQYVRDNYCPKAVEVSEQLTFLKKHFGVTTKCKGTKSWSGTSGKYSGTKSITKWEKDYPTADDIDVIKPKPSAGNVWGRTLDEEDI